MGIFCVIISFAGLLTQEIEYLYPGGGHPIFVAQYNHELPAIFLADLGYETFSNYFELGEYDSSAVVKYENPTIIRDLLEEKASPDQFILYVINDQKGMDSVSEIASQNGYAEYKELYSYNGNVCYLLSK